MKILFTGGGTAGSVTPLLAVAAQLQEHDLFFIGTTAGVERKLVPDSMHYLAIASGKLRRYWSWKNLVDPFIIAYAWFESLYLMAKYQPDVIVTAGSFVSVPVVWAGWMCNVKVIVHQQDLQVGLATKLMAWCASVKTKAFQDIPFQAQWIGNPVRDLIPTTSTLNPTPSTLPTLLIFGGGTGAQAINDLVSPALTEFANVIHITGSNKPSASSVSLQNSQRYQSFELLTENFTEALQLADLVVCRAGLGTISELAELGKPAIIIPMPQTHQELNAQFLAKHQAAVVLDQTQLTPETFMAAIKALLGDKAHCEQLAKNIHQLMKPQAAQTLAQLVVGANIVSA